MSLFATKRFLPLFVTQFLGAFNDNLFKNAMVMLITYRLASDADGNAQTLITLSAGLFILPFFLFSALAGQLADKYERTRIVHLVKLAEIILMVMAIFGFLMHSIPVLMVVLFAMGMHSTFFGPLKYALLPQHLNENELLPGNAAVEAGTFLAILLGTLAGGLLILHPSGEVLISAGVLFCAVLGYASSRFIPSAPAPDPSLVVDKNIFRETGRLLAFARSDRVIFLCILGISWFWFVGATFLSQFPAYAKNDLHADETVVTLFLILFSVGIGVGSFLCNKLLKGNTNPTYVPLAGLGISAFSFDLSYASAHATTRTLDVLTGFADFVRDWPNIRILIDLLMIGVCGGLYIVPLYAMLQKHGSARHMARLIAANNIMNALFMVASAIAILGMIAFGFTIAQIFLVVAILSTFVSIYICKLLPDALLRSLARFMFTLLYRVEISGLEHYANAGKRVLIIANHASFLDAALIAAYLPDKITFAVNSHVAQQWWLKPFLSLVDALPMDPSNPMAAKRLIEKLQDDHRCMIFPEGRITVTGALMKIYEGPGMIADKADAVLLPIRIDGAQYSPFSRLKGKVAIRPFPKIRLTILPPCHFSLPNDVTGRKRRQMASAQLYDIMCHMMFVSSRSDQTVFGSLLEAQEVHGRHHLIAEDTVRKPMSYGHFTTAIFALSCALCRIMPKDQNIGVLLPNAVNSVITFFALQALGRTPAMLNYTSGGEQIVTTCNLSTVKYVLTSRRFVELGRLDAVIEALTKAGITIKYLEDVKPEIHIGDKLTGKIMSLFPGLYRAKSKPTDPAVILFTSGSEGKPKGVVLSHANIQSNRQQLGSRIDFGPSDRIFTCLPIFHAFGLTAGTILPILSGIKTFFYPSPLHYRIVPELIYDTNSTILFGTDTFLSGYVRQAHPYDLHSVRYVFAGAEKLRDETRQKFIDKFGVRIFEGYGATETAPVLTMNTPLQNKPGSAGRLMPDIEYRLDKVEGIEEGGQLWVRGPNIMMGYLRAEKPGVLQPPEDGWYDTGDVVSIDEAGFVTIQGRMKRFAKIAGEMVSLSAVEAALVEKWPEFAHAVVSIPDDRKGEQIILATTKPDLTRDNVIAAFREKSMPELSIPRKMTIMPKIPLLGTGKTDYQTLRKQMLETHSV